MKNPCFDRLKTEGADYSKEELEAIKAEAERFLNAHRGKMSDADFAEALAREVEEKEAQAVLQKWRKAVDLDKRAETLALARAAMGIRKNDPLIGFKARLDAEHGTVPGLRDSAFRTASAKRVLYHDQLFRGPLDRMDPALWKLWTSDTLELEIAEGMIRIRSGQSLEDLNANAARIAKQLHVSETQQLRDLNQYAVGVKANSSYAGRNTYDPAKIQRAKPEYFVQQMMKRFDIKDVEDAGERAKIFREAYDSFVSTIHGEPDENFGHASGGRAQAAERVFLPKDAEAWIDHTREFGFGSLRETWTRQMDRRARLVGLMDKFGFNYRSNLEKAVKDFIAHQISDPAAQRTALEREWNSTGTGDIQVLLKHVTGEINVPVNHTTAAVASWVRTATRLSILGAAMPAHFNLIATAAGDLHYLGWKGSSAHERGYLSDVADIMGEMFSNLNSEERRQFKNVWGLGTEGLIHSLYTAFDTQGNLQRNINNLYFNLNLMHPFINAIKTAYAAALSGHHYNWAGRRFDALPEGQRIVFANHGITPAMWDVIRTAKAEIGDYKLISPEAIRALPDEDIARYAKAAGDDRKTRVVREDIATRYTQMMLDRVDMAAMGVTPKTRKILMGNEQAGTIWGEWVRKNFAMIKTYPVQAWLSLVGREMYGYGARSAHEAMTAGQSGYAFAKIFALSSLLGYASLSVRDLAAGKTAPDPMNRDTWFRSIARGGALGLYADFIWTAWERQGFGAGALSYLAGPAFGKGEEAIKMLDRILALPAQDRPESSLAQIFRFGYHQLPLNNLIGVRLALDNLIYYNLMEEMSPGYLQRTQRSLERMTEQKHGWPVPGQHYWNMPQ